MASPPPSDHSSSPWANLVRGPDSDAAPSSSSSPPRPPLEPSSVAAPTTLAIIEQGSSSIVNAGDDKGKKLAWSVVPSNDGTSEVGSVMGASSWPALSSVAATPKSSSSSDSLKTLSDGSIPDSKGSAITSPPSRPTHNASSQNPNIVNHVRPVPRKTNFNSNSMRGGGSGTPSSGGISAANGGRASGQPDLASAGSDNGPEYFNRDLPNIGSNNWDHNRGGEFGSHSRNGGENHRGYGGNRRGNNSSAGSHHGGYGSRREHDRGGYDWHAPRGFNGRDPRMPVPVSQLHGHSRPFIQVPPPAPAPFFSTPGQGRPFLGPVPFPEMHSAFYYVPAQAPHLEPLRPYFPHQLPAAMPQAMPMIFSPLDQKQVKLLKQIEFYFSPENLCRDTFLRQNMDDQGWVPVSLIANFNRVKQLTNSIAYILDTVQASTEVELQGHKLRKRNNWMSWILRTHITPTPPTTSDYNRLIAGMNNVSVKEASTR